MRARDLARPFPTVSLETDALTAARVMGDSMLPGLIVVDAHGAPHTVLGGSQVLRFLIPRYIQDDPALSRVYDETGSDRLMSKLSATTVADVLPRRQDRTDLPVVDPDATTIEIAAVMARLRSPVVAVVDDGHVLGAVTVSRLFEHLFPKPVDGGQPQQ